MKGLRNFSFISYRRQSLKMIGVLVLILLLALSGCKSKSHASYDDNPGEIGITDFGGIKSIDEITDTTVHLTWDYHPQAVSYKIFYKELAAEEYEEEAEIPAGQTSALIQNLTIDTSYYFKVMAYDQWGHPDDNQVELTAHTNLAPPMPGAVMLQRPARSPGFTSTPTFSVRYVKSGETIRIYRDASCTQEIGSGVVAAAQTSINISSMALDLGSYQIYANATNIYGHTSACSTAHASYVLISCPDASYVAVDAVEDYDVGSFCVFKTEAKNDGNDVPVAQFAGDPWVSINANNAKAACKRVEVAEGYVDLVANDEWMVMARDIEATAANWSGGVVGSGVLNRGHSDQNPNNALSISDSSDPWDQTGQTNSSWGQKRTHTLSSGNVIWDLAGNVEEWTDWEPGGATFTIGPTTCPTGWTDPLSYSCEDFDLRDYRPANPAGLTEEQYTASNTNVGKMRGGSGGAAVRGANYTSGTVAGIFSVNLNPYRSGSWPLTGFRCVWRPE